jgi:hypothetical protein
MGETTRRGFLAGLAAWLGLGQTLPAASAEGGGTIARITGTSSITSPVVWSEAPQKFRAYAVFGNGPLIPISDLEFGPGVKITHARLEPGALKQGAGGGAGHLAAPGETPASGLRNSRSGDVRE